MLLTRHGVAVQVGPDGFLQLVVRGRLLEAQAQVALQVLVQLVSWKQQAQVNKRHSSFGPTAAAFQAWKGFQVRNQ